MIREFLDTDLDALLDVWYTSSSLAHPFLEEAFMQEEKKNIRDIYIPNTKTWVYEQEGKVEGFISMMGNEIGAIFVRPEFHGHGFGRKLMDQVVNLHDELEVEVFEENKIGRKFYDKYGFSFLKEHIHEKTGFSLLRLKYTRANGQ